MQTATHSVCVYIYLCTHAMYVAVSCSAPQVFIIAAISRVSRCNNCCNTLQHTATKYYNTLQHTATHSNTQQHTATHCNTPCMYMQTAKHSLSVYVYLYTHAVHIAVCCKCTAGSSWQQFHELDAVRDCCPSAPVCCSVL